MVEDHSEYERGNPLSPLHGLLFRIAPTNVLYAQSHRQESTDHNIYYTSCGALAGTRNSLMGLANGFDPTTYRTMITRSITDLRPTPAINKRHCIQASHVTCES